MKRIATGIYSYGRPTTALYISYKDELGKAVKKKIDTLLPDEAKVILAEVKAGVKRAKLKAKDADVDMRMGRQTLDQAADIFFADRETANNKKDKQRYFNHISPTFGDKQTSRLTVKAIGKWRGDLALGNKTRNDVVAILKMLLPKDHKVQGVEKLDVDANKQKGRVLKDNELQALFGAVEELPQLNLFIKLCYYSGARPIAILELTPNHFKELENGVVIEIKAMKEADSYEAPITDDLMDLVDEWIEANDLDDEDALFFGEQNIYRKRFGKNKVVEYSVMSKRVKDICDPLFNQTRRGKTITDKTKRVSIYTLRRTAATNIAKKVSLVDAQKFLNHKDPKTTMKYIGLDGDDVRKAMGVL